MADGPDINEVVRRATEQVLTEMQSGERLVFGVQDLKTYLSGVGRGAESAWEISYKTSAVAEIEQLREPGGLSAWEISYKTSAVAEIEQTQLKK